MTIERDASCCERAIARNDSYPQAIYFVICDACGKMWQVHHYATAKQINLGPKSAT